MRDDLMEFAARYRSLAATTCEWRAFGVADPDDMADRVFERLARKPEPPTLVRFYQEVEVVVDQAYRTSAGQNTIVDMLRAQIPAKRAPKTADSVARDAMRALRHRDLVILQQAYWDDLTPDELAEVQRTDAATALARLTEAAARFGRRLAPTEDDPVTVMRRIKPGTRRR